MGFLPTRHSRLGVYGSFDEIRTLFEEDWFRAFPFHEWEVEVDELIDNWAGLRHPTVCEILLRRRDPPIAIID